MGGAEPEVAYVSEKQLIREIQVNFSVGTTGDEEQRQPMMLHLIRLMRILKKLANNE